MIIDADTHFLPPDACDYIEGPLDLLRPRFWFTPEGLYDRMDFPGDLRVPGTSPLSPPGTGSRYLGASQIEPRLEDYRRLGIDRQLLFPQFSSLRLNYALDPELATAIAHSYNIAILNLLRRYPSELIGGALVALQDVDGAVREIEWAVREGFRAVILDKVFPVREHPYGETLGSHRELWPFFRRCAALGVPVFLHNIAHGHRTSNLMKFQSDGLELFAPPDGHMSLMSLVTSGLFDEVPRLKIVFTEAGTAFIAPLLKRFDDAFETPPVDFDDEDAAPRFQRRIGQQGGKRITPPEVFKAKNLLHPSEYFRRNVWFTIETEEESLAGAVRQLGASQFLFATDYPHDDPGGRMKWKDVDLLKANDQIDDAAKDLIFSGNAQRLLQQPPAVNA